MQNLTLVASYSFPHEAQVARANLESAGIPAFIEDEHTISMQWLYSDAIGGVKVLVDSKHYDEAIEILETDFSSELDELFEPEEQESSNVCPNCNSSDISPHTVGKKPAFVVFLLLGFPLFFYKHVLKCNQCGEFWRRNKQSSLTTDTSSDKT